MLNGFIIGLLAGALFSVSAALTLGAWGIARLGHLRPGADAGAPPAKGEAMAGEEEKRRAEEEQKRLRDGIMAILSYDGEGGGTA